MSLFIDLYIHTSADDVFSQLSLLQQSAGVSTGIAVTASFSQQTEDRAFCPVVQLL